MITIDVLSEQANNVKIHGDYDTVAYEVAKAMASYLVVYVNSKDIKVRQSVIDYLVRCAIQMLPQVEEQIMATGTFTKMPREFLTQIQRAMEE